MEIKSPIPVKYRHEFKHELNPQQDFELAGRIGKILKRDTNAGLHGTYRVSSLYFDSPFDHAIKEKIDGVNRREKFRLRYYGDNTDFVKLEKKSKWNSLGNKQSAVLTKEQTQNIIDGNINYLLHMNHPLCIEFYSKLVSQQLKPKTVVIYDREAFVYEHGNVRITFDRNLRTGVNPLVFLDPRSFNFDISNKITVLEVKYDEFLPEFIKHLVQVNTRARAFSKYTASRQYE